MKDYDQAFLEGRRPTTITALQGIDFCLEQLYGDKTKEITDEVVAGLTFEELIGILLLARDQFGTKIF